MYEEIIASDYHMAHNISHCASEDYLIHSHGFYELYYFITGDVYVLYDGTEYVMQPHTLVVFIPNVFHGIYVRSRDAYERFTAHFTEAIIAPDRRAVLMGCLPTEESLRGGEGGAPYIIRGADALGILPLMQSYQRLAALPRDMRDALAGTITEAILAKYLMYTVNNREMQTVQPHHAGDRELTPILSYIHKNLTEKISLDDLSQRFHISKGKLNSLFHRQMGVSTMEYVAQQRVHYARQLLINGVPAAQAGSSAGFGDYTSFFRAYKKQTGRSPGDDRRLTERDTMDPLLHGFKDEKPLPHDGGDENSIWTVNQFTQATTIDIGTLRDPQ